jgi:hypothetical protein
MAATLHTEPASPAYQRDSNFVVLETDQITLAPATVDLDITGSGPSIGQTLELTWSGIVQMFTVAAAISDDALSIPTKGAETLEQYALIVVEALRQNDVLTTDFFVLHLGDVSGAQRVRLQARVAELLDVTVTESLANVAVTVTDGVNSTAVDNLSAYLQVFQVGDTLNDDALVAALHAPYELSTAQAAFDLKDLFDLAPALPTGTSIDPTVFTTWPHAEAVGAYANFYLRYAEKSGVPAVSSALLKSADYYVLFGGRPGDVLTGGSLGIARLQHAYLRADGELFVKPLGLDQPDWVYVYTGGRCTGCYVELQVTWDTGDVTNHTAPGDTFTLEEKTLYWLCSGPLQHNIAGLTPPTGATDPVYYNWRLMGDYGLGVSLLTQVRYKIYCACHPHNLYLLLDNGVAGMESVHFRGRSKFTYSAERDTARRLRWRDHTVALGDVFTINSQGQQSFELNTGWHDRYYIEHLRQLLLGDLWLIDTQNKRFLRLVADTKSFDVHEDDQQLHSLSFTVRAAWLDTNIHLKV